MDEWNAVNWWAVGAIAYFLIGAILCGAANKHIYKNLPIFTLENGVTTLLFWPIILPAMVWFKPQYLARHSSWAQSRTPRGAPR